MALLRSEVSLIQAHNKITMLKVLASRIAYLFTHILLTSCLSIVNYTLFALIDLYGHQIPNMGPYSSTTISRATKCCECLIIVFTTHLIWTRTPQQIREIWLHALTVALIALTLLAFGLIVLEGMKLLELGTIERQENSSC